MWHKNDLPLTTDQSQLKIKDQKVEIKQVLCILCYNISFNSKNHLSQLQSVISDFSKISKQVSLKLTISTQIIKKCFF